MLRMAPFLALFIFISNLVLGQSVEEDRCAHPLEASWTSRHSRGDRATDWAIRITSGCAKVLVEPEMLEMTDLRGIVKEWSDATGEPSEITQAYRYNLTIENDSGAEKVVGLTDYHFLTSGYVSGIKNFGFSVPACSKFAVSLYSVMEPESIRTDIVIAGKHPGDSGWNVFLGSSAVVVIPSIPVSVQLFSIGEPLPKGSENTISCR